MTHVGYRPKPTIFLLVVDPLAQHVLSGVYVNFIGLNWVSTSASVGNSFEVLVDLPTVQWPMSFMSPKGWFALLISHGRLQQLTEGPSNLCEVYHKPSIIGTKSQERSQFSHRSLA